MEAKIKIVVDEERAMERVKAAIGRMKVKKNLWILCGVLTPPLLIDTCIRIYQYRYNFGMLFMHVIMGIVEGVLFWFLGHEGLVIEKELLTKEQLEFVKKKCDAIKNHSKWM